MPFTSHGLFMRASSTASGFPSMTVKSVAQTAAFAVCGSSLDSRSRTQGQTPVFEICGFCYGRTADPKDGGPRYPNTFAGGAPMHRGAPRTRATSLSPRPIRGRFWLPNGGTGTPACALCMECISLGHRQECLCPPAVYHCQYVSYDFAGSRSFRISFRSWFPCRMAITCSGLLCGR